MAAARELAIADDPAAWAALGFAPGDDGAFALGGLTVRLTGRAGEGGLTAVRVDGLLAEHPDGLPVVHAGGAGPAAERAAAAAHPNGARAIDHLVAFTDDRDRTTAALTAAGGDLRRRGDPPELPAPMAFVRFGELIVEVAQAGGPARFWGDHGRRRRPRPARRPAPRRRAPRRAARPADRDRPARGRAVDRAGPHGTIARMTLTLPADRAPAYVHADNRALVISNGLRGVVFNRAQGRWIAEALGIIADEQRATRMQQNHVFGGYATTGGRVVLFAGTHDDLVSIELSAQDFAALREEFVNG